MTLASMSDGQMTRKEFWEWYHSGRPFSIVFVTCDIDRRTGGLRKTMENVTKCGTSSNSVLNRVIGFIPANGGSHAYQVSISNIEFINGKRLL